MRELTAGLRAELAASPVRIVYFLEAEFRTGVMRLWTGQGTVTWPATSGQVWNGEGTPGAAGILQVGPIEETAAVEATGLKGVLSGLDNALLGRCLDELRIGKRCRVWMGVVDAAGAVIDAPYMAFAGQMDMATVEEGGETTTITVTAESELIRLQIPVLRRLTLEDQRIDFPNDTFFKRMSAIKNFKGTWGSRQVSAPAGGGGGGCPLAGAPVRLYGRAEWWTKTTEPAEEWMFLVTETGRWGCFTLRDLRYTKRGLVRVTELEAGQDVMLTEEGDERLAYATHVRLPGAMCDRYEATQGHVYSAWGFIGHNKRMDDSGREGRFGEL